MTEEQTKTPLALWLESQMQERDLGRNQLSEYSGVSTATISEILNENHIPKLDTLIRLARFFRVDVVTLMEIGGLINSSGEMAELHPRIRTLLRRISELDLSLQMAVAQAWEQNLDLAVKMLEQGKQFGKTAP